MVVMQPQCTVEGADIVMQSSGQVPALQIHRTLLALFVKLTDRPVAPNKTRCLNWAIVSVE
jgi:hypothetical protein